MPEFLPQTLNFSPENQDSMAVYGKHKRDLQNLTSAWRHKAMTDYFRISVYSRPPQEYTFQSLMKRQQPLPRHPHFETGRRMPAIHKHLVMFGYLAPPLFVYLAFLWRRGLFNFFSEDYIENRYTHEEIMAYADKHGLLAR